MLPQHAPVRWTWLFGAAVLLWLLALLAFGLPGRTFGTHSDLFLFFAWINAADHGQVHNVDFRSPLGTLAHLLPYLGYLLAGGFGGALEAASLIVLAGLLPCAVVVLARRVPLVGLGLLVLLAAAALVVVPWNPGNGALTVSQGGFYNRWCWSALAVLLLLALPTARATRWSVLGEGITAGVLLTFLFFTKASYFLVGFAFAVGFGVLLGLFRRAALIGAGIFVATALVAQTATGSIDDYIGEIAATLRVSNVVWDRRNLPLAFILQSSLPYYGILLLGACLSATASEKRLDWRRWLWVLYAGISTIAIQTQNGSEVCTFTLLAPLALLAAQASGWRRILLHLLTVLFASAPLVKQAGATYAHATVHPAYAAVDLPRMDGVFYLHADYIDELRHGVSLLSTHGVRQGLVALDRETYFAALLDIAPIPGRLWCLHPGRTIDRATAPAAETMFAEAEYILVRKDNDVDYLQRLARDFLLEVYGRYLRENYQLLDEDSYWELWRRKKLP